MQTNNRKLLTAAGALILCGAVLFIITMGRSKWDFNAMSTIKMVSKEYEFNEKIQSISIDADTTDITFRASDTDRCRIEVYEDEKMPHRVKVDDGKLSIRPEDQRKWYEHIVFFSFGSPKLTVYLPAKAYTALRIDLSTGDVVIPDDFSFGEIDITTSTGDVSCEASSDGRLKIGCDTGNIDLKGIKASDLMLSVSTGHIYVTDAKVKKSITFHVSTGKSKLTDVTCENITSEGSTGDADMENVIASGTVKIKRSTGHVKLEKCDAYELFIKTSTGKVSGSFLTDKVFITSSDTGKIDVPKTISGGRCEITTDTGNIIFK
ncbi:MAG: DUF4097 domain-containing protein [Lachnospiraceae bacterium]|nr:DUF4097 domain-containing protein [Lachnospiraceae bacterium]